MFKNAIYLYSYVVFLVMEVLWKATKKGVTIEILCHFLGSGHFELNFIFFILIIENSNLTLIVCTLYSLCLYPQPKIYWTHLYCFSQIIKSLGGEIAESIEECTHLVTDKVRRTMKFLCGVARGILIVQPAWLEKCKHARMFIGMIWRQFELTSTLFVVKEINA